MWQSKLGKEVVLDHYQAWLLPPEGREKRKWRQQRVLERVPRIPWTTGSQTRRLLGALLRLTSLVHILWGVNLAYLLAYFFP